MNESSKQQQTEILKPVTLWYKRYVDRGETIFAFNHLEDGHCPNRTPTPKFPSQINDWGKARWLKDHVALDERNKVTLWVPPQVLSTKVSTTTTTNNDTD